MQIRYITVIIAMLAVSTVTVAKDLKIGYVHSQRILAEFQESTEAQQTLDDEQREWLDQARQMEEDIVAMEEEMKNQSLLTSEEKKAERIKLIEEKYIEYQRFQKEIWGETGKLFQRNQELTQPLIDKIDAVIHKIGEDEAYDFIFDAALGNMVYAKDDYDLTDRILEDLNE